MSLSAAHPIIRDKLLWFWRSVPQLWWAKVVFATCNSSTNQWSTRLSTKQRKASKSWYTWMFFKDLDETLHWQWQCKHALSQTTPWSAQEGSPGGGLGVDIASLPLSLKSLPKVLTECSHTPTCWMISFIWWPACVVQWTAILSSEENLFLPVITKVQTSQPEQLPPNERRGHWPTWHLNSLSNLIQEHGGLAMAVSWRRKPE